MADLASTSLLPASYLPGLRAINRRFTSRRTAIRMFTRRHRFTALAVLVLCTAMAAPVRGQSPDDVPAGPLTLDQVLTLAEKRSESIAISRAAVQRAEGEQTRARSGLYPQLSAQASYDRALASEFEGIFDTTDF